MNPQIFERYSRILIELKKEFKRTSLADLCLAYVRYFKWIDGIILNCDSVQQLEENARIFKNKPLAESEVKIVQESLLPLIMETPSILDPEQWTPRQLKDNLKMVLR